MSSPPRVSVCVPTRNRARLLRETVDSVLAQTFRDLEVIVTDDMSSDETPQMVKDIADPRVRYHRNEPGRGLPDNWNSGIERARGELILVLHDDDTIEPTYLERAVAALDAHPSAGIAFVSQTICDAQLKPMHELVLAQRDMLLRGNARFAPLLPSNRVFCGPLVRSSLYKEAGAFRKDMKHSADWETWLRLALHGDVVALGPPALARYRTGHGSLTDQQQQKPDGVLYMERETELALEHAIVVARRVDDRSALRLLTRALAQKRWSVAMWRHRAGDARGWRRGLARAFATAPSVVAREPRVVARALLPRYRWPAIAS